ncbi:amylo-alpha-1,6-glucosidase [Saccharomonospora xinjiangensis]|uniref:Glycogen debranching enzyme n=1 Tax=Saccharomonospora xinjiangensis XJ-54 TaxID=882086 RepID=I0V8T2_9PSEU|nr:glycogen debranching N-terminal domain-containing protein [Saccharomonospora xinjiangensis]EID56535.1 glycogen debranching enzyme [Saccharomonospora xinjiangensis XJ-54]
MTVTLVHGTSFCVCDDDGDFSGSRAEGAFYQDTRILSGWQLRIDGRPVEPITVQTPEPFHARFVGRAHSGEGEGESSLLVRRERYIGGGMREDLILRNYGRTKVTCTVSLRVTADFADVFEVKAGRIQEKGHHAVEVTGTGLHLTRYLDSTSRGVRITGQTLDDTVAEYSRDRVSFRVVVAGGEEWYASVGALPVIDGTPIIPLFPREHPVEHSRPAVLARRWREESPVLRYSDNRSLAHTLQRSREDLGALRMFDPDRPDDVAIAAGAPWFMALFGRDSLLASLMSLAIDPTLALGTVQTLAHHQGTKVDPDSEEEPGRILHEVRFGADVSLALGGSHIYFGTVDATPLFVMLLGELSRWGIGRDHVEALLGHADRALDWIDRYGDRDGDGFVEYHRATERGLINQGWKDSWDGVNFADGTIARSPIALCEVQGYVYAAFVARAELAENFGDREGSRYWRDRAGALRKRFNERFWLAELGRYALGLDGDKRPIDSVASNIGHCLWTGIVDESRAESVANSLLSTPMFSGWGIRTLSSEMGAYNPMSYHNGSVWPHDNALIAAGLMRYGFVEHAQRVAVAVFDAARAFDGRLPELMCGFDRSEYDTPVPYPTSCSPQAWASAAPVHLLRTLLRFQPSLPHRRLRVSPALPESFGALLIDDVPLGGSRISIEARGTEVRVGHLPSGIELVH